MQALPRKERERLRQRQEIQEAAQRVFSIRGFHNSTVNDIALEAEFGVGTIYKHFPSKEDLYFSLVENKIDDLGLFIRDKIEAQAAPADKIKALINAQLQYFQENEDFFKIYILEISELEKEIKSRLRSKILERYQRYLVYVSGIFKEGIKKGYFKKIDPLKMAVGLLGIIHSFISYWIQTDSSEKLTQNVDSIYQLIIEGVGRGGRFNKKGPHPPKGNE
ncbi:MAG: TetR/AcrR family transcriptional regulator [Deltaproteobacteria bacterium]|nr:MAG: TetR/AcrR family transcriptional regulator [Deltaproteobacteria bacterium]